MILEQFSNLKIAKFEIVLQSHGEAILPALIGSTLRGAFGHALKAISCSVEHQDCERCLLSEACLYPTIFEPTSKSRFRNLPRPFVFEPPIPPFSREFSRSKTLKIRVQTGGKIPFYLTLIGETVNKLPYFIYAFELMARHGLGADRQQFSISEVFQIDENLQKKMIYEPAMQRVSGVRENTLKDFVKDRLEQINSSGSLRIQLKTPLRIRRQRRLLEKITFTEFFKQCSLRAKLLSEYFGKALDYDYQTLMKKTEIVKTVSDKLWRHNSVRRSNRQKGKSGIERDAGRNRVCCR